MYPATTHHREKMLVEKNMKAKISNSSTVCDPADFKTKIKSFIANHSLAPWENAGGKKRWKLKAAIVALFILHLIFYNKIEVANDVSNHYPS